MMAECYPISFPARALAGPLLWIWLCNAVGFGVLSPSLEGLVVYLWHLSHWIPSFLILIVRPSHMVFVPFYVCLQLCRMLVFICHSCRRTYIDGWPLRFPFRVFFGICPWYYCEHICQAQKESSEGAQSCFASSPSSDSDLASLSYLKFHKYCENIARWFFICLFYESIWHLT